MVSGSSPLCFVVMPFGARPDDSGTCIDFDAVYAGLIAPAIRDAGLDPLLAAEESGSGTIHKAMFERMILAEYAVADLTTADANLFYVLGVRHAVRPHSTVLLFAQGRSLPFDAGVLPVLPYQLDDSGKPANVARTQAELAGWLKEARGATLDSPVLTLAGDWSVPEVKHTKTDTFRERAGYSKELKRRLETARRRGVDSLAGLEQELGSIEDQDTGVVIDLFLSYRAVKAWPKMLALFQKMSPPLQRTVMVQEQLALALNRAGESDAAERILTELIARCGPSSETNAILGRVYKDRWAKAAKEGDAVVSGALLGKAIDAYLQGFEADWRDAFPGINAVTLMELANPPDERRQQILPVVRYAVERRIASGRPDYWDYATLVELAVLGKNEKAARVAAADALARVREPWEPETTARNLRLINQARARRGELEPWMSEVEKEFQ